MEKYKTHMLRIRGHIFYVALAYASQVYKLLGSDKDMIEIKNDEKKMYMKAYKREVSLIPLDDMELIIQNCPDSKRNSILMFIEDRKTRGVPTTPRQLEEFLQIK